MAVTPITKDGYTSEYAGNTRVKIDINADGNIAQPGEQVMKNKNLTIKGVNINNSLSQNTEVIQAFLNFANGSQDSLTNIATATWEVAY